MHPLLPKYFDNSCSVTELKEVESWIQENPSEFELFHSAWNAGSNYSYPVKKQSFQSIKNKIEPKETKSVFFIPHFALRVAAAVILLAVVGLGVYFTAENNTTDLYAHVIKVGDKTVSYTLPDGSQVWLKDNATLSLSDYFDEDERRVKLNGDAFFEVAKNADRPFTIETANLDVKVIGTSFNIIESKGQTKVDVKTGKVLVSSEEQEAELNPNQSAVYSTDSRKIVISPVTSKNTWSWADKIIEFNNTPLSEVIAELEEVYGVAIEYNKAYSEIPFTGKFNNNSIEEVLEILQSSLSVDFQVK